MLSNFSGFP